LTFFLLAGAALLLFSGIFYLFPRRRAGSVDTDLERANLEWFRQRRMELAGETDDTLERDAQLRLLEDEQAAAALQGQGHAPADGMRRPFPLWILLPLVALVASLLYYRLGAAPDVVIGRQLQALGEQHSAEQVAALIGAIETRVAQRPGNLDYAGLLGQYYMGEGNYRRAAELYAGLAQQAPGDAQAMAFAAQADYLASGRVLGDQARLWAEQALAVNPHQPTALGLLGMVAFEQQQYRAAVEYWQRLLAMEQPGSDNARMIEGVIATARERLGEAPAAEPATVAAAAVPSSGVTVTVALPAGAAVAPSDTVFILARDPASGSRMPIAVQRLQASQLPVTLRLDDSNSMAGQKLSAADSVMVFVQVSPDGRPGEEGATWLGQAGPLTPSDATEPLEILLQPRG